MRPCIALLLLALLAGARGQHDDDHSHAHAEEDHAGHSHGLSEAEYEAALARGEDPCALEPLADYNLGLHIGAIFILLAVSLLGSLSPVALRVGRDTRPAVKTAIRLGAYFGFGTLLATALIHMLLPAVEALGNPCLAPFWREAYEAWPYLFVLVAILAMQLIDFAIKAATTGSARSAGTAHDAPHGSHAHVHSEHSAAGGCGHAAVIGAIAAASGSGPAKDAEAGEAGEGQPNTEEGTCPVHGPGCNTLLKHEASPAQTVGIYLAEAGVIFHSVMIGLSLGVADGSAFTTLLIALSFHQFFEGWAIGSAAVDAGISSAKATLLGVVYSLTTPCGIAVGIGVHESFNQNASGALLATGILDALSTGILLYVALAQLIPPMLTDSRWLLESRWPLKVAAYVAFWGGAAVMAVIGKWA